MDICKNINLHPVIWGGGAIKVKKTRKTENPRGQGLEVPCKVIIKMPNYAFVKADVVIRDICSRNKW